MKNNVFGKHLKELRIEKGLSQQKLGLILGFCHRAISFWENGSREPDLDTLVKIARYFEVSLEELLDENK